MINIYDYCAVNWEATSDNIRALLYSDRITIALPGAKEIIEEFNYYIIIPTNIYTMLYDRAFVDRMHS